MERPKTSSPVNSGFNGEMMMTNHLNVIKNNMQYMYIYIRNYPPNCGGHEFLLYEI
jgi:hypothetical protein